MVGLSLLVNGFKRQNSVLGVINQTPGSSGERSGRFQSTDRPPHIVRRQSMITPSLDIDGGQVYSGSLSRFKQMSCNFIRLSPTKKD